MLLVTPDLSKNRSGTFKMQQDAHGNLLTLNVSTSSVSVASSASGVMGGTIFLYLGWL